jgi:acyl carrier protein
MEDDVYLMVRDFVAEYLRERKEKLSPDSRLLQDLGVDGADAVELLEAFSEKFGVDMAHFPLSKHFGPEAGFNLFYYLYSLLFKRQKWRPIPITLRELAEAVRHKRWPEAREDV